MSKLQELLTANKRYLWGGDYDIILSSVSTDIGLWKNKEGDIGEFIEKKSLNDLIFGTDFIRRLQWNTPYWDTRLKGDEVFHDHCTKKEYRLTESGYIICRLAILDSDLERISFIENNTHL